MNELETRENSEALNRQRDDFTTNNSMSFIDLLRQDNSHCARTEGTATNEKTLPKLQIEGLDGARQGGLPSRTAGESNGEIGKKELANGKRNNLAEGQTSQHEQGKSKSDVSNPSIKEMKSAYGAVDRAVADLKHSLQDKFKEMANNKDGSFSQEQLKFLKDHSKEGYLNAVKYNGMIDSINQREQSGENQGRLQTDKRINFVNDELSKLPKSVQKEFHNLPMVKDGVGYSQMHVEFLRNHAGDAAADVLQHYVNERRRVIGGAGNKN